MQRSAFSALDRIDPLAPLRDQFLLPPGVINLDGNSLGALPRSTAARVSRVIEKEWGEDLITSWNRHDWIGMPQRVGDKIARLIGAEAGEVVVAESTSINLFKVLAAALKMRPGRRVIVSESENFPTDLYMAEGLAQLLDGDYSLRLVTADDLEQVSIPTRPVQNERRCRRPPPGRRTETTGERQSTARGSPPAPSKDAPGRGPPPRGRGRKRCASPAGRNGSGTQHRRGTSAGCRQMPSGPRCVRACGHRCDRRPPPA